MCVTRLIVLQRLPLRQLEMKLLLAGLRITINSIIDTLISTVCLSITKECNIQIGGL